MFVDTKMTPINFSSRLEYKHSTTDLVDGVLIMTDPGKKNSKVKICLPLW